MAVKIKTAVAWVRRRLRSTASWWRIPAIPGDGRFIEEIGYYDPTKEPAR